MKIFFTTLIFLFSTALMSQNLDSVLRNHDTSVYDISNQGLKVLDGEWTWVGKNLSTDKLRMVVTKDKELIKIEDVVEIEFKKSRKNNIEDIKDLVLMSRLVPQKDFRAIIIR